MNQLPTLAELTSDKETTARLDELSFLLNQEPPVSWIKYHPFIKDKKGNLTHKYIPIDKIEYLLKKIFKRHRVEILREGQSFNGVYCCVRLHYLNPVTNEWEFHDGIGAIQLQTKSGSTPADLANINNGAISMAFPHAKTLAIKDAAEMLGKIFGSDLNRRDTLGYSLDNELQSLAIKPKIEDDDIPLLKERLKNKDISLEFISDRFDVTSKQIKQLLIENE